VFHPRCGFATDLCANEPPVVTPGVVGRVRCHFPLAKPASCQP
jgi:hypothetical protein